VATSEIREPGGARVPQSAVDLTSAVMTAALGRRVDAIGVERVGAEYGFSGESYLVSLVDGGELLPVIAKLWRLRDASDVLELHFYDELAPYTPVRLPTFHHGGVDHDAGCAWLVIEALPDFRQGDDLVLEELPAVLDLVAVVARVHAAWWGRLRDQAWLPAAPRFRRDPEYLQTRRVEYLERFGHFGDPLTGALFDKIPEAVLAASELLHGAPPTLVHQDLAVDNVLFLRPDDKPVLIDWARCGRGAGGLDLASILFGVAPLVDFSAVSARYEEALAAAGSFDLDRAAMKRWLGGAMIHAFISATLGVARWAADTPRGLRILDAWVARTPHVVSAWQEMDPGLFDRLLS